MAWLLAVLDRAAIETQLPEGQIEDLRDELDRLARVDVPPPPDASVLKDDRSVGDLARDGCAWVLRVRLAALRRAPMDLALHRGLGIGDHLDPRIRSSVLAGLDAIVHLAGPRCDELSDIGLRAADLAVTRRLAAGLRAADDATAPPEPGRAALDRPLRCAVEAAIAAVAAAGAHAFHDLPAKQARYADLLAPLDAEEETGYADEPATAPQGQQPPSSYAGRAAAAPPDAPALPPGPALDSAAPSGSPRP
jgi:hypothetical protein